MIRRLYRQVIRRVWGRPQICGNTLCHPTRFPLESPAMKQLISIIFVLFGVVGCVGSGSDDARMVLNVDTINFCNRPVGETVVWNDVQLLNASRGELTLSNIAIRGNETCAFEISYPRETVPGKLKTSNAKPEGSSFAPLVVPSGQGIVLKVAYTPSGEGVTDTAALVITSDAANLNNGPNETVTTVIPMCGVGEKSDASLWDAGVELDGGDPDAGERSCGSCGKALKKGVPGCKSK